MEIKTFYKIFKQSAAATNNGGENKCVVNEI